MTAGIDFMDPANKGFVLDTLQDEIDQTFELVADRPCGGRRRPPVRAGRCATSSVTWSMPPRATSPASTIARNGGTPDPRPRPGAAWPCWPTSTRGPSASVSRDEMIARLRADSERAMGIFSSLSDEDWTGLIVSHPYMGPLPAMFYPMFQLVDYAVHSWDIREGMGQPHALSGDATDLLVPIIYILWQATADTSGGRRAVHGGGAHQWAQRRRHAHGRLGRGRAVRAGPGRRLRRPSSSSTRPRWC